MDLEKKLRYFQTALCLPGLKVVDTSFLGVVSPYGDNNILNKNNPNKDRTIQRQLILYNEFPHMVDESVTFPEETLAEIKFGNDRVKKHIQTRKKSIRHVRKNNVMNTSEKQKREKIIRDSLRSIKELQKARVKAYKEIMERNPTEEHISDCKKSNLPKLNDAFTQLANVHGVLRPTGHEVAAHAGNDEKILAKSIAISYDQPVIILTGDGDFPRMQRKFYRNIDFLAEKHGFEIPEYDVDVLHGSKHKFTYNNRKGETKKLSHTQRNAFV